MRALPWRIVTALCLTTGTMLVAVTSGGAAEVSRSAPPYQYGINTYVTYGCSSTGQVDKWAKTEFGQFKALKANSVAIGFPLYTDSITSNNIYAKLVCGNPNFMSPPADILSILVDDAHHLGLKVLLRPMLDQANLFKEGPTLWRGVIAPTSLSTWFTNYLTTLRPYLMMAQAHHVEHFAIETELNSIAHAPNWTGAISITHALYHGDVAFNYSFGTAVAKTPHSGTSTSVDTYPAIGGTTNNSTPAQLLAKWNVLLARTFYAIPTISKTTIDEIGIPAQDGAYSQPYNYGLPLSTHPFDQKIQVNWFTAACAFMKTHHMKGIYFWGPYFGRNGGSMLKSPAPGRTDDIQPLAQQAIKKCF